MGRPVVHFEIFGEDEGALQGFYADVFDWAIDATNPINYGLVDTGGQGINGGITRPQPGQSGTMIYIEVSDLDATLDAVRAAGGETVAEPQTIPGMVTFAQFRDPAGNVIGLVKSEEGEG